MRLFTINYYGPFLYKQRDFYQKLKTSDFSKALILLAGLARFELAHARVKVWCLTAWLQSNVYKIGGK